MKIPFRVQPMLATLVSSPFHKEGWIYEEKYDGVRILAYKEGARVQLLSRNAKDRTASFPRIAAAIAALPQETLLLDGEVVIFDPQRVSRFQLLQLSKGEPVYAVFDCLYNDGHDLRKRPLSERRPAMEQAIERKIERAIQLSTEQDTKPANKRAIGGATGSSKLLFPSRRLAENGLAAYRTAKRRGFEGLVAKDLSSPYVEKRSLYWLKVKVHQEDEFIIAGFTKPTGARQYIGALLLAAFDRQGALRFVGKVGTGFTQESLYSLHKRFQALIRKKTALADPPREKDVTYLAPQLIAQVSFQEWTADQKLRQPVFLGLRDDKNPREVLLPLV